MREERALRLSCRARRVDEQQSVVIPGRGSDLCCFTSSSSAAVRAWSAAAVSALVRAEEDCRLGVCELIGELRPSEPCVQRHQDQACLRAGEEDDDVLGARARQRRHPVARHETGLEEACGEPVGPLVELPVGRLRIAEVDRNAARVVRARSLIQRPNPASAQELLELLTNRSGSCHMNRWPHPAYIERRASRISR